jgi:hypothetical protein
MQGRVICFVAAVLAVAGCTTRSISDSGYPGAEYYGRGANPLYRGELNEFDVLGIDAGAEVAQADIEAAFAASGDRKSLRRGDAILLIQSGAMIPDAEMVTGLEKAFAVTVFSGVPERSKESNASYARALRLAAAKAGIETIVAYWGTIETGVENLATKTISWVPIVGAGVPDEAQVMRLRLKIAVVDVRTGRWEMFTPKELGEKSYSARLNRARTDQAQVAALKTAAYGTAAETLIARLVR